MRRRKILLLVLVLCWLYCVHMGSTSGVTIDIPKALSDSKDSVLVYIINNNPNTNMTQFEVVAKHDAGDTSYRSGPKSGLYTIANLKSNKIYRIRGRAGFGNGTYLEFGEAKWARTAPEQPTFGYIARPTFVIFIIVPTPGATKWTIHYSEAKGDVSKKVNVPDDTNGQYYSAIIKNLRPNFRYTCYVHVTEVDHKKVTNTESPILGSFTTAPLSLFGRVLSTSAPFQTDFTNQWKREIEDKLKIEYIKLSSTVSEVRIIEVGNDTSGFPLIHHEVFLGVNDNATVNSSKYVLPNTENFYNSKVYFNVTGSDSYAYVDSRLWSDLKPLVGCQWKDNRTWTTTNEKLTSLIITLPNANNSNPSTKTDIQFHGRELLSENTSFATFAENTINAIGHNYLIKYCPVGSNLTFYNRIYKATANGTASENQYGIIYTTGPDPLPNDNKSIIIRPVTPSSLIIQISVPPVNRAVRYDFYIKSKYSNFFSENITLLEKDLDSSPRIEVSNLKNVTRFNFYDLSMQVTTRLANGSTSTSPISSLTFYAGFPNQTEVRIVEIYPDRFTITWESTNFTSGYNIIVTSTTSSQSFIKTTSNQIELPINNVKDGQMTVVKVAGFNNFGQGRFSNNTPNKIWSFPNITPTSITITWEGETSDEWYVVSINDTKLETKRTSALLSGLKPGKVYQIQVSFNSSTQATQRVLFQTSQTTGYQTPQNVRATFVSNETITVMWDRITWVSYYKLRQDFAGSTSISDNLTNNTMTLFDLQPGSLYKISVAAQFTTGQGNWSAELSLYTVCNAPYNLKVSNYDRNSVKISWTNPRGSVRVLITLENRDKSDKTSTHNYNSSDTQAKISDLDPKASTHHIFLVAFNPDNRGSEKSQTIVLSSSIPNPARIWHTKVTNTSVTLQWEIPRFETTLKFRLEIFTPSGSLLTNTTTTMSNHTFKSLTPGTRYKILVTSITEFQNDYQTSYENAQGASSLKVTTVPNPPTDLKFANKSQSNLTLTWSQSHGATSYLATVESYSDGSSPVGSQNYTATRTSISITNLSPSSTSFKITLVAINVDGLASSPTKPLYFTPVKSSRTFNTLPWWVILASCCVVLVLLVGALVVRIRHHKHNNDKKVTQENPAVFENATFHSLSDTSSQGQESSANQPVDPVYSNINKNRKTKKKDTQDCPDYVNETELGDQESQVDEAPEPLYDFARDVDKSNVKTDKEPGQGAAESVYNMAEDEPTYDTIPVKVKTKAQKEDENGDTKENEEAMPEVQETASSPGEDETPAASSSDSPDQTSQEEEPGAQDEKEEFDEKKPGSQEDQGSSLPKVKIENEETSKMIDDVDQIMSDVKEDEESEEYYKWKERLKFSLKGKPGKLKIIDRTAKPEEEIL